MPPAESPRATSFSAYLGGPPIVLGLLPRQINLDVWDNLVVDFDRTDEPSPLASASTECESCSPACDHD